jgi:flagella basal body P-ring formation protein FlgA
LVTLDIAAPDAALAGDPVDVHYRNGAFELEAPGELEQDARVGQEVRVRVSQASRPAIGRLVAPHIVELESQP